MLDGCSTGKPVALNRKTLNAPITIDVVVECQLFMLLNLAFGKDAHSNVLVDGPPGDIAVRSAAMICETTKSSAFCRIDELDSMKVRWRSH